MSQEESLAESQEEPRETAPAPVPPCPECGGACAGPEEALTEADCQWLGNRLDRMYAARPEGALNPWQAYNGDPDGAVEWAQLEAFEAGAAQWWLVGMEGEEWD